VGAITVLGLYKQFRDRWFLEETFEPLLRWNRWWSEHRDMQGYLAWGSDGDARPANVEDESRGHGRRGVRIGLDNSRCTMRQSTTRRRICWSMPMWG